MPTLFDSSAGGTVADGVSFNKSEVLVYCAAATTSLNFGGGTITVNLIINGDTVPFHTFDASASEPRVLELPGEGFSSISYALSADISGATGEDVKVVAS